MTGEMQVDISQIFNNIAGRQVITGRQLNGRMAAGSYAT